MMRRMSLVLLLWTVSAAAQPSTPGAPAPGQSAVAPAASVPANPAPPGGNFPFDRFQDFSAVMVGSVLGNDDRESHIYRSGSLLRTQMLDSDGYMLTDLTTFESFGITKLGCTSDPHVFFRAFPFSANRPARKLERAPAGRETMDGHPCLVEEVTITGNDLPMPMKLKFWEAEDLNGFPVRVEAVRGKFKSVIQYKNVVLGPGDPSLFLRPVQCKQGLPQPDQKHAPKKKTSSRK